MSAVLTELSRRWQALASRERFLLGAAAVLMAVAMLWWVGISPALTKIKQSQQAASQLDAQLQLMQAQAQEAASLKGQRQLSYDESLRSLETAVKTLGSGATLVVQDSRASVTLKGASGAALAQWLAQVRANARLVPAELRLQKSPAGSARTPGMAASSATAPTTSASPSTITAWDGVVILNLPAR